jgi:hypothetical protein
MRWGSLVSDFGIPPVNCQVDHELLGKSPYHIIHQLAVQIIKKSANVLKKVPGLWALAAILIDG